MANAPPEPIIFPPELDKILGMQLGHALGDALGVPHEFHPQLPYTGLLQYPATHLRRYQKSLQGVIGQVSDDTEMTISTIQALQQIFAGPILDTTTVWQHLARAYMEWAHDAHALGKNTRALFCGITTLNGFLARWNKNFAPDASRQSVQTYLQGDTSLLIETDAMKQCQSNGSLMRATAFGLIHDLTVANNLALLDCNLTNPNNVNRQCSMSYLILLRRLLAGDSEQLITAALAPINEPKLVHLAQLPLSKLDPTQQRGWVGHAWVLSLYAANATNYSEWQKWLLTTYPKSDTDTVAAISGAVVGAKLGLRQMLTEETTRANILTLLSADYGQGQLARPEKYHPRNYLQIQKPSI